jgi:hypothetical protein
MRIFAQEQAQLHEPASSKLAPSNIATDRPVHHRHPIPHLQRALGNQGMQRMLQTNAETRNAGSTGTASARFGHEAGRISAHPPAAGVIQMKLALNTPGDTDEQEAEQVANEIVRMPEPQLQPAGASDGECLTCQTKLAGLQTRSAGTGDRGQSIAPPIIHDVLASPGHALDPATRAFMEPRFGHDFSDVRVHTDTKAAQSAQAINALAYTVQRNIVFDHGQYAPGMSAGRSLIAHELTHVVQQRRSKPPGTPGVRSDRTGEHAARAIPAEVAQPVSLPVPAVTHRNAAPYVARQAKAQEFPGFSQGEYVTCGAASLISALMIWDRERKDPNAPNTLLVAACNTVLVYMDNHKQSLIKGWNAISIKGTTGHGQEIYDETFDSITTVRDAAKALKAQITESQYQDLGLALYVLYKNNSTAGLTRYQMQQIQDTLGIGATKSEAGTSFDDLLDKLTGLQPGQIAQISWYSRGKTQANGMAFFTPHAFLVGRFQRGAWFVSDQGAKPPTELEAPNLILLKAAIRANTQARDEGIHTGGLPTQSIGGMQFVQINPGTGVMILGERAGIATTARDVIMKPGDFIAEVDASAWHAGDRIMAWDFVARAYSLAEARTELNSAGTGSGGVIVENPIGLFHVFKTSLVSDTNVMETKIDESDSKDGKVTPSFKRYYHAWLQLRSASKTGAFFQVY